VSVSSAPLDSLAETRRGRLSLAQKFAIAFLGLVAAVLVINGAIDMAFTYRDARAQAVRVQQEKADAASAQVVQFVTEIEQQLGWTTRAEWARISVEQRRYDFIRLMRQAAAITELVHVDGTGKEQLKLSRLEPDTVTSSADLSADPRFVAAVRDRIYYGPVTFRRGSEPYMTIAMAHAGRNAGVTIAEVNLKLAWDVVTAIRVGETGYAFITDPTGRLIAHPDMSLVLRNTNLAALPQVKAAMTVGGEASRADTTQGPDGRDVLSAFARVPKVGWSVFVELPAAEALGPVWKALYQTLALLALGVVLAGGAGALLARRMVVPIRDLQAGAQRLGEGDLTQRIPVRTGDEIGALAQRFNTMAGQIQESQETLERKVEDRTADLNEALEYQKATSDVLNVISSSPTNVQPVLDVIAETAARLCEADLVSIRRRDGNFYRIETLYGYAPQEAEYILAGSANNVTLVMRRAIAMKATCHFPDVEAENVRAEAEGREAWPAAAHVLGVKTSLCVPLLRDGELVGVLLLSRRIKRPYTPRQIALVETFADQAVIAIENARLFNETKEALVHQTGTGKILQVIAASPTDIKPVLQAVAESACDVCDADDGAVLLKQGDYLVFSAHHGPIPIGIDKWLINRNWTAGRAVIDRATVHLHDLQGPEGEEFPDGRELSVRMGHRTIASVPLMRDGEAIGAMVVRRKQVHPFTEKQLALLKTFADQSIIAINNVRLFEEVQERTRDLGEALEQQTATAEVLKVISRSVFNLDPVLQTLIDTAVRLGRGSRGTIFVRHADVLQARAFHQGVEPGLRAWLESTPLPINGDSNMAVCARERRIVEFTDLTKRGDAVTVEALKHAVFGAAVWVPLVRDGDVIGVFGINRKETVAFSEREVELVKTFADQAVIAIENSRLFEEVQAKTRELEASLADLTAAQTRLIQSEKLASLGQLTAGIAHEIKNPLNFVNNFADLSVELVQEIEDAIASAGDALDPKIRAEVDEVSAMLKGNLAKVVQHGRRADSIVKNMLAHSRESGGELRMVDLNATVDEALNLAYHGARAERPGFNITLERHFDPAAGQVSLYPQEFTRVLLNLIGNGFHAANKKRRDGAPEGFEPTLSVTTAAFPNEIRIKVRDNGTGIPDAVKARIFEPFFTTKPTGEGTGLGLSLSHDIVVKQHGGKLDIMTAPGEFTEFTVTLPRKPISPEVHP
jgi:signal transduction histidine kinase